MKTLFLLSFVFLVIISSCVARDLLVGSSYNTRLVWQQKVEYHAFPFLKRVKEVFYSDPAQQIIKAVIARDNNHSEATAIITAGGVGFPFATIRLKSERGGGLNYDVEIYV